MGILRVDKLSGLETPTAVTGSVTFDGNDRLAITPTFPFEFGGSDFTIEMWVNMAGTLSTVSTFFSKGNDNSVGTNFISLQTTGNNTSTAFFFRSGTAFLSGPDLELNRWYHLAVTRSGDTFRFFVDGKLVDSGTNSNDLATGVTGGVNLGAQSFDLTADSRKFNGSLSNVRILKGTALYTEDFVPEHALEVVNDTILLCCNNSDSVTAASNAGIGTHIIITTNGDPEVGTTNPSITRDLTYGTEFKGVTTFDTQGYFVPPSGTTTDRDRSGGRLLWGGGQNPAPAKTNTIEYLTISSLGNSRDFGDLTLKRRQPTGASSSTRGVFIGGDSSPTDASDDLMDYVTIASQGNAVFFGNLQAPGKQTPQGCSNGIRGISYGGGEPHTDQIDVFTIASLGDATDFGDADVAGRSGAATESSTRALLAGGVGPADLNRIEYITMATNGDGQDFGDLVDGRRNIAGTSDGVRAVFAGGFTSPGGPSLNTLDYVTIATFGNSQDFGDLTMVRSNAGSGSCSNKIRGLIVGGQDSPGGSPTNSIDYITIASTGNAKDFGDAGSQSELTQTAVLTDSHGGIS